jgi:hypothetical protein
MDKILPALLFIMHENFKNNKETNFEEDYYEINEKEERDLERYIFGGLGLRRDYDEDDDDINASTFVNDRERSTENIKIKFRRSTRTTNSDNEIGGGGGGGAGSRTNIDKADSNSSNQSSPKEDQVMITMAQRQSNMAKQPSGPETVDPDHEAKMLLKNIASKADYTTISKIVLPILAYLDDDKPNGWEYSKFVRCVFLILMYNVKQQHAIVIKNLINHLDSHRNSSAQLKCFIIRAISICIRIAAMHSVGTTGQIIEIFTNLLKHLNFSVEKANLSRHDKLEQVQQQSLQREIIAAMGKFTSHLPDYAKNDVIMFIARQINSQQFTYLDLNKVDLNTPSNKDQQRVKYFECLHEICTKYKPTQQFSAFTSGQFLEDILRLTLVSDWASRRKAHEILHLLLDKYQFLTKIKILKPNLFTFVLSKSSSSMSKSPSNTSIVRIKDNTQINKSESTNSNFFNKYSTSNNSIGDTKKVNLKVTRNQTYLSQLELNESKLSTSKEDMAFMRKYGGVFLAHLNENIFLANNRRENYESIYLTTGLFLIGLFNEKEFLIDFVRFGFHVQELALLNHEQSSFSFASQCSVHKFVAAYFLLLSKTSGIVELQRYCSEICDMRRKRDLFKFVYPEYILLDSALLSDSGNNSTSQSLSEVETEFKRDLNASAKEYATSIQTTTTTTTTTTTKTPPTKNDNEKIKYSSKLSSSEFNAKRSSSNLSENPSNEVPLPKSNSKSDTVYSKMSPWLFDKKKIASILENNSTNVSLLTIPNSDFSLSVGYLQQTLYTLQTVLRFRSPYSNSFDSIVAFNPHLTNLDRDVGGGNLADDDKGHHNHHLHRRGFSVTNPFPNSINIGSGTPRDSVDVESHTDDGTSYDSQSNISIQTNDAVDASAAAKFDLNYDQTNQNTVTSFNLLKSQQYHDSSSFEIIKQVLFNDNTYLNGSNFSNSGVGTGTIGGGPNSTVMMTKQNGISSASSSMLNSNQQQQQQQQQQQEKQDIIDSNNLEIISEFKHMPYDEIREKLKYLNNDKYQDVLKFISKEHNTKSPNTASVQAINGNLTNGTSTNTGPSSNIQNQSQLNGSLVSNLNNSTLSLSNVSNQSTSGNSMKETLPQKIFPLNDIEFPQLFMY